MIGGRLGHYRIVSPLGEGGMGVVYRAFDERLEREVALKVLPKGSAADDARRKRFRKEALALSKLNHPNIATVFDFDADGDTDFLVMELVPGTGLDEKLREGPLPEAEVRRLGLELAQGLAAAHERGVVHRDLKPANLRVLPDGRLKILDFGLATLRKPEADPAATVTAADDHLIAGTVPYMAPEQFRGRPADARSDIYAAGTILYELATGRRPFESDSAAQLIAAILEQVPARPEQVPKQLQDVILKALEKDPARRQQSAAELASELEGLPAPARAPVRFRPALISAGAAVLALLAVWGVLYWRSASPLARIRTLAVLPLENLSRNAEEEYFADGMTDELITDLAKIRVLRVISRSSVMPYKGARKTPRQVGRELKVDAVVEGSVLRAGDRVRITAQLVNAASEDHLWAESYERDLRDVLALQREVARAIAGEIRVQLSPQEQERLSGKHAVGRQAHEAYLRGRHAWAKQTDEGVKKAVEYFQEAIRLEPAYAQAYAGLADSYTYLAIFAGVPPREVWPKASAAAARARQLDDLLAEAHISTGAVHMYFDWDWEGARREFERALELNPGYSDSHHYYAHYLEMTGKLDQAIVEIERARELDPLSAFITTDVAMTRYLRREPERALEECRRALELDSGFVRAEALRGGVLAQQGRFAEAIAIFEKLQDAPDAAHAYGMSGNRQKARAKLAQLLEFTKQGYILPLYVVIACTGAGEKDLAIEWLEKSYRDRDPDLGWIKLWPQLDPMRADPRFKSLVARMGLP